MAAPIIALSGVTGIDIHLLSQMAGRQTPFLAAFVPLILVFIVDGRRGIRQTWPVAVVAGLSFAIAQFVTSNFIAVEITDVVASVVTVIAVLLMLRVWKPAHTDRLRPRRRGRSPTPASGPRTGSRDRSTTLVQVGEAVKVDQSLYTKARLTWNAVMPYVVIIIVFSISQIPVVKLWIAETTTIHFPWPELSITDAAGNPVGTEYKLNLLGTGGTLLLISGHHRRDRLPRRRSAARSPRTGPRSTSCGSRSSRSRPSSPSPTS